MTTKPRNLDKEIEDFANYFVETSDKDRLDLLGEIVGLKRKENESNEDFQKRLSLVHEGLK